MSLPGDCDDVSFFDPVLNITHWLKHARLGLQGYVRAYKTEEIFFRRETARSALVAERLFSGSVPGATSIRRKCDFGIACLEVLCLLMMPVLQAINLLSYEMQLRSYSLDAVLSWDNWIEGANSWPLFGMLALLADHLDLSDEPAVKHSGIEPSIMSSWDSWLATYHWDIPRSLQSLARLQMSTGVEFVCSPEAAVAAAAAAPNAASALAAVRFRVQMCREAQGLLPLLRPSWSRVWHGLDRLGSLQEVNLLDTGANSGSYAEVPFQMSLLPPHIRGANLSESAFWFLGDRIRAKRSSHCNPIFKVALEVVFQVGTAREANITVFDVGAHLGDCCLWAGQRFKARGILCVAFERDLGAAQAIRRSIRLGNLGPSVQVREGEVASSQQTSSQQTCRSVGPNSLDCAAATLNYVDLVKIHIGFKLELGILEGFVQTFAARKVGVCLVRATEIAMGELHSFVERHQLKYTLVPVRQGHDVALVSNELAGWAL